MDIGRGHEGDPRVAMVVVVPREEDLAMGAGVRDAAEACRGSRVGTSGS